LTLNVMNKVLKRSDRSALGILWTDDTRHYGAARNAIFRLERQKSLGHERAKAKNAVFAARGSEHRVFQ